MPLASPGMRPLPGTPRLSAGSIRRQMSRTLRSTIEIAEAAEPDMDRSRDEC